MGLPKLFRRETLAMVFTIGCDVADTLDDDDRRGLKRFLFGGDNMKRNIPTPFGGNGNPANRT